VYKQLRGIASDRPIGLGPNKVLSVPDAIGIAIEQWWRDKQGVQQELLDEPSPRSGGVPAREQVTASTSPDSAGQQQEMTFDMAAYNESFMATCPDCGSQLEYAEGCVKCHVCGFSECG
jgi:ribonucleoside-diphosphate reductase alpha chain